MNIKEDFLGIYHKISYLCRRLCVLRQNEVDTQISGWMNYYMKFGRSEFRKVLNYINERLTRWVMRKYKRFSKGRKFGRAYDWLVEYAAHNRNEFSHWVKGFVPYPRLG